MKIAVLIPTRGNRPEFFENCLRMVRNQTVKPDRVEVVIDTATSSDCDITWRYKLGYERLRNKGFDIIFLMEDDDYYAPDYIETMLSAWGDAGKPDIFGTDYTIYYHIKLYKWLTMHHQVRSSAMSTMIVPDLKLDWNIVDNDPYTDLYLWRMVKGRTFKPEKHICIGIKHGSTMTGGRLHTDKLHQYVNDDSNKLWLQKNTDPESFKFYSTLKLK